MARRLDGERAHRGGSRHQEAISSARASPRTRSLIFRPSVAVPTVACATARTGRSSGRAPKSGDCCTSPRLFRDLDGRNENFVPFFVSQQLKLTAAAKSKSPLRLLRGRNKSLHKAGVRTTKDHPVSLGNAYEGERSRRRSCWGRSRDCRRAPCHWNGDWGTLRRRDWRSKKSDRQRPSGRRSQRPQRQRKARRQQLQKSHPLNRQNEKLRAPPQWRKKRRTKQPRSRCGRAPPQEPKSQCGKSEVLHLNRVRHLLKRDRSECHKSKVALR